MEKLYKEIGGQLHYWETWEVDKKSAVVHWGVVGEKGEDRTLRSSLFRSALQQAEDEHKRRKADGYAEIDAENLHTLIIEYTIDGYGSGGDLSKRHAVEDKMQETLGWTGLGHCDGGSIGSGTMEICCFVVDFEIAKSVIEKDLLGTEFAGYHRIYNERADEL